MIDAVAGAKMQDDNGDFCPPPLCIMLTVELHGWKAWRATATRVLPFTAARGQERRCRGEYLFALWEELGLTQAVTLVLHDWGSTLGCDWARQHPERVRGLTYIEAAPLPLTWSDFPDEMSRHVFEAFRSEGWRRSPPDADVASPDLA